MLNKDYLDNVIKSVINDSASNIEISRDIFNEAWSNKEIGMSKRKHFNIQNIRKAVLVPACCVALALVGVLTFSPGARVAAQEAFKTIFLPDKSGNIVEKSEDTKIAVSGGFVQVTDQNREAMEKRIGFKFNLPEKIGDYSYKKSGNYVFSPHVSVTASGVKYKDSAEVLDKLEKALNDDKVYEELEKDYKLTIIISASYEDNKGHKFQLVPMKDNGKTRKYDDDEIVKEVNIDGIKCTITHDVKFNYNDKKDENGREVTDLEHKPESSEVRYDMWWSYDGVRYAINIGENSSDIDAAIEFAANYIKILKQK